MKPEPIWEHIDNTKTSLFRFEGLQDYSEEDGDNWVRIFNTTGKLIELPGDHDKWWRGIKEKNQRGIITQRVRLVTEPLTDYTKAELAYLKEAAKYSGDDIRIIDEKSFKQISPSSLSDFWLVDDLYVFVMSYDQKGKYLSSQMVDTSEVDNYVNLKRSLLTTSEPLI